ncbi:MAG: hypothetical protein R2799_09820 [Crocinitomicaceae bacterium]
MKNLFFILIVFLFSLNACNIGQRDYTSPLPGMWYIENAHGPHADDIVGGYIEFTEDGRFIWNTTRSVIEGQYEDMEEYFVVQYSGHEDKKKFDFKLSKEQLIIIPENSGQKFFLKKVK